MGKKNFSETKAYLRLVLTTLWIISAIAFLNFLIIMNSLGTDIFKPIQRNIAAVTSQGPIMKKIEIVSPIIEINCRNDLKTKTRNTRAHSARVVFKNCKEVGRLINQSNDNQGDVFPLKKHSWTSDYISLKPGLNTITAPLGEKTQTIEITREVIQKLSENKAL